MLEKRFRLGLTTRPRLASGQNLGQQAGPSTEFRDHRDYQPGDDIRHLDWAAYARTDRLMVKRFFEEATPELTLLMDSSESVRLDPQKKALIEGTALELTAIAKATGIRIKTVEFQESPALALKKNRLRPGASCIVISDFLFPEDPAAWMGLLSGCIGVGLVQLLSQEEIEPKEGAFQLVDAETGERRDLVVDAGTVRRYKERLQRLCLALEEACGRRAFLYARASSEKSIGELFEQELALVGIVRAKG
jgi:hypothetical protein